MATASQPCPGSPHVPAWGKELEDGGFPGEGKSADGMGRKDACSLWGTNVCRQLSFVIATVCGISVFLMTKKATCSKFTSQEFFSSWKVHIHVTQCYTVHVCLVFSWVS